MIAGLEVVRIINEPTAVTAYGLRGENARHDRRMISEAAL
jgi:molecular chaperone DnaK (HSP70)